MALRWIADAQAQPCDSAVHALKHMRSRNGAHHHPPSLRRVPGTSSEPPAPATGDSPDTPSLRSQKSACSANMPTFVIRMRDKCSDGTSLCKPGRSRPASSGPNSNTPLGSMYCCRTCGVDGRALAVRWCKCLRQPQQSRRASEEPRSSIMHARHLRPDCRRCLRWLSVDARVVASAKERDFVMALPAKHGKIEPLTEATDICA